jgi:hypothetical protein
MKSVSTTALAKELRIDSKELFDKLLKLKMIYREGDKWQLTDNGKNAGGIIVANEKFGDYIAWPEGFNPNNLINDPGNGFLNATKIGFQFQISPQRVNLIFSELGWIEEAVKGWKITPQGSKIGGVQKEHTSGGFYINWPVSVLEDPILKRAINPDGMGLKTIIDEVHTNGTSVNEKTEPKYPDKLLKTKDGHKVRSRAEVIIDNLLYDYGLTHAYERELTVVENVLSDFYIPARNGGKAVYIEYWGISDNDKYKERKEIKQAIYIKNNLNLIELDDSHIDNLDSHLRKQLLNYNINVE